MHKINLHNVDWEPLLNKFESFKNTKFNFAKTDSRWIFSKPKCALTIISISGEKRKQILKARNILQSTLRSKQTSQDMMSHRMQHIFLNMMLSTNVL